ncbi:MAG: hypothetical protein QG628_364, partial [Patescibacteria group bacterium]|nr:hypothetical protein [Patescibacteria group bacterium]
MLPQAVTTNVPVSEGVKGILIVVVWFGASVVLI